MPWTKRTIPLNAVLKAPHETIIFICIYGRIFPERFVTKNSYQPSIKMIVLCGAFKTASSGMVRSVHGTHPLIYCKTSDLVCIFIVNSKWKKKYPLQFLDWNPFEDLLSYSFINCLFTLSHENPFLWTTNLHSRNKWEDQSWQQLNCNMSCGKLVI